MAVNIHNLIAAIVPDIYCKPELKDKVKKLAKEKGYLAAAEEAETPDSEYLDLEKEGLSGNPFELKALKNPIEKHHIEYDNFAGKSLEPIYYWFLDYLHVNYDDTEKLVDNFVSAPGSALYTDIAVKMGQTQQNAQRYLELANTILKSIMQLVFDLKDWKLRLKDYDSYNSKNQTEKKAALLSLKERWLDLVDLKRGQGSIKSLANQFDFVTLLNGFMACESLEDVKKMDLNEIVKNILTQRLNEFFKWIPESEKQSRLRYELEKRYLKAQADSLKLYVRWAKPYLKTAHQLESRAGPSAAITALFENALSELTILGKGKYNVLVDIGNNNLPKFFKDITDKKYQFVVILEFKFRTNPQKTQYAGGYTYRGKMDVDFTSYALTEKEIKVLKEEIEKDDLGDLMAMLSGTSIESLELMQKDVYEFLEDESEKEKKEKEKKASEDINPFSALFSIFKSEKKSEKESGVPPDTKEEKVIRDRAIVKARVECSKFYGAFKGSNDMPNLS